MDALAIPEEKRGHPDSPVKKRIIRGLLAIGLVCFVAFVDYAVRGPNAKRHQAVLVETLHAIPDVKDASVTGSFSGYKTSHASAVRDLVSGLPMTEVRAFYISTLQEQGWQMRCESVIEHRERIVFARDEDTALLDLPESDSEITGQVLSGTVLGFALLLSVEHLTDKATQT